MNKLLLSICLFILKYRGYNGPFLVCNLSSLTSDWLFCLLSNHIHWQYFCISSLSPIKTDTAGLGVRLCGLWHVKTRNPVTRSLWRGLFSSLDKNIIRKIWMNYDLKYEMLLTCLVYLVIGWWLGAISLFGVRNRQLFWFISFSSQTKSPHVLESWSGLLFTDPILLETGETETRGTRNRLLRQVIKGHPVTLFTRRKV